MEKSRDVVTLTVEGIFKKNFGLKAMCPDEKGVKERLISV